jgi:hypothetical protein
MHAGKPWRKSSSPQDANREKREHLSKKPEKQVEKKTETRGTPSTSSKACLNLMIWLTKTNRILLQSMVYDCLFPYVHRIDQLAIL